MFNNNSRLIKRQDLLSITMGHLMFGKKVINFIVYKNVNIIMPKHF